MKKKWLVRIGLVFGAPVVLLLLIELVWQIIGDPRIDDYAKFLASRTNHFKLARMGMLRGDPDPEISFTLTSGFEATIDGNLYRINEHGMRGGATNVAKPAGIKRVLILGDSYAFGFGVGEDATIAAQLQAALAGTHPGMEVLNMGVPGYQTGQEERVLRRDGLRFNPDLVVLVYYANDKLSQTFLYDPRLKTVYTDELPLPRGLKQFLSRSIVYSKITKAYTAYLSHQGELNSTGVRHWPVTAARLKRIAGTCAAQGIGFVLVAIPALDNSIDFLKKSNVHNLDHDRLLTFARDERIHVADVRAVLLQNAKPIENLFVSAQPPKDSHFNRLGYGILVATLVARIRAASLLQ